jgi:hypothetical protein
MASVKNHPNFDLTLKVTEKLLQIQKPIKVAVIVISIEGETAGSVIVGDPNITEQAKINVLMQVVEKFKIPWSYVTKGSR